MARAVNAPRAVVACTPGRVDGHTSNARAQVDGDARVQCPVVQPLIERCAVDDERFRGRRGVRNGQAGGREESSCRQRVQDRLARQIELVERFGGEHAGAVHRLPGDRVLLEQRHVEPGARQQRGGVQPSGAPAYDDDIMHEQSEDTAQLGCTPLHGDTRRFSPKHTSVFQSETFRTVIGARRRDL